METKELNGDKLTRFKNKLEIYNTLILAIATLAVTWCSYQGILWSGIQAFRLADANKFGRLAQETTLISEQHKVIDAEIVQRFVQDVWDHKTEKINFYLKRLRPELSEILRAWMALNPMENDAAPPHPLAMPAYKNLMKQEMNKAEKLRKKGEDYMHEAQQANTNSDNYSLCTVVFSMVMFLGAIASKLRGVRISFALIVISGVICVAALAFILLSMPLAVK